jgi:hypothetical protein
MANLLLVHEQSTGEQIIINQDLIIVARTSKLTGGRSTYTTIKLVGDTSISVLEDLKFLVQS